VNTLARILVATLAIAFQAGLAAAQTIPSSFKDLQFLVRPGDRVTVVDAAGLETTGRVYELGTSTLSIASKAGDYRFNEDQVLVIRQRKADSIKNGVLIGLAIGGGLGLLAEISCGWDDEYCGRPGVMAIGTGIWGAGIGAFADALQKTPRDIFRHGPGMVGSFSVSPVVGPHAAGAQVAFRW
jgi:hypothetical protein